ncbi:Phage tail collar domain containing protein [uncultured Caudovirales phage]|uniref:Phage tail collar domain containing protein n=1 Tax=uncultured Caudovirales phage TaxID=2100421 RepID=A0A6J5PK27_9CAUD|nr:Phage tail collar domain containing protein [uncultured Caudovirales phage]CAB4187564.1 Phage tail collar domain containing protein [uncultured Caudovirales phage]CAB4200014.1 Phage tail collar domain containing protein [uncultured Caudovirales phage]
MTLDLPVHSWSGTTRAFEDVTKALVPPGIIVRFDGPSNANPQLDTCPNGWLRCQGQSLHRAEYASLSRIYPGSGSVFNIPNQPGYIVKV